MHQDDPIERAFYIVDFFGSLLTSDECDALRNARVQPKIDSAREGGSHRLAEVIERKWITRTPEAERLLAGGYQALCLRIADRILRECPEKIRFNRCPRCGRLTRTPRARQCRHCFFDWHSESSESTP